MLSNRTINNKISNHLTNFSNYLNIPVGISGQNQAVAMRWYAAHQSIEQ